MELKYKKLKNLFMRQSYVDAWEDYERSLRKQNFIKWDYIILTASNEAQAQAYRQQLDYRLKKGLLPATTKYVVLPDPGGKRVGSGGATFHVLKYISEECSPEECKHMFEKKRILVIHSGGDSKRVPQYSACGKLFSPVPRELPNGEASTLFDEFMIGMSGVPSRIQEGMLVLSGDVLLLFNPLQIDMQFQGAAVISMKEHVDTGKNHGVFLDDGEGNVEQFLHKQTEEVLRELGAVNEQSCVNLDTGAVLFDAQLLQSLFSLISTNYRVDTEKFDRFVNEKARVSFYGDFLYPLAKKSTLSQYLLEKPEGSFCEELTWCREKIWEVLHPYSMKLLSLAPAKFIHFGTTKELLQLVTDDVEEYEFLDWKRLVATNSKKSCAAHNSYIDERAQLGSSCYIEDSIVGQGVRIGAGTILSCLEVEDAELPSDAVLHGLQTQDGRYVVRIYGICDNPKGTLEENTTLLGGGLQGFLAVNGLQREDVWNIEEAYLWFARLYPVCDTMKQALQAALVVYRMSQGMASVQEIENWRKSVRVSLYSSFNDADVTAIIPWKTYVRDRVLVESFVDSIRQGVHYADTLQMYETTAMTANQYELLMKKAKQEAFGMKLRIYYYLSQYMKKTKSQFDGMGYDAVENLCFETLREEIYKHSFSAEGEKQRYHICRQEVHVSLPVRVNWGGGWTDTPPYCNEHGGTVLNAAVTLNGNNPVQITVRRLSEYQVQFESQDVGVFGTVHTLEELLDCHNPYDAFALHKAALIACGVIPLQKDGQTLEEILRKLGGGIYLSTQVINVPKGSGLGTSSILAGACVKGIHEFLGIQLTQEQLYDKVLCMEQLMSTGGGWQDQVGGLTGGMKLITSKAGMKQQLQVEKLVIPKETMQELNRRFVLIYTGQRRLARNLLREVVGNYIGNRPESLDALYRMQRIAALMKYELEHGTVDAFAQLLNEHWELSKQLDSGSTNTCIEQIFIACEDLIAGRFIAGAGGGGFLQVILKKDVTREQLKERLEAVFQNSGVEVWDCELTE